MADRGAERGGIFWSLVAWGAGLVAAFVIMFLVSLINGMGAGLAFGAVGFVVIAWVLSRYLGPASDDGGAVHAAAHPVAPVRVPGPVEHAAVHRAPDPAVVGTPVAPVPVTPEPAAPVSAAPAPAAPAPAAPAPAADAAPGAAISERVREAARAAGAAARAALSDGEAAGAQPQPLAAPVAGGSAQPARLAAPEGEPDNLTRLKGVGPKFAEMLNANGIFHFRQIAAWGPGEIAWIEENFDGFTGRVVRDDWVGQARILAAGGETEHSQRVDRGESS